MQGTIDGFSYGLVTPVAATLTAWLGGALGLHCTARSLLVTQTWRPGWLALGSAAIGSGVWTMHFIAMMGFAVGEAPVHYDRPVTYASLGVAIGMVGIGVFIVGYRGARGAALFTGGAVAGLGIATMHYLGMAGMRLDGELEYDTPTVAASVVIAMAAATAALRAAGQARGFARSVGASLVLALGVAGTHYLGMAAVSVRLHGTAPAAGDPPAALLAPVLIGPVVFLGLAAMVVLSDPLTVAGRPDRPRAERKPGVPVRTPVEPHPARRLARGPRASQHR